MDNILVAHDGSASAKKALLEAISLAEKTGAKITVISVVPVICFAEAGIDCETVMNIYRAEASGILEAVRAILKERGLEAQTIILEGNPADVIVDFARDNNISLIVVGSTGKDATQRTLLGSVSSKIAVNAPCSVLIVR
ncbi:MAG: universal stress protein [Caldimicrobium sp.]|nr:universal stress protein [Caldimicrobium sp.]MCX7613988.1 universal stress protein [Caldimicrobium sp.]MDW8182305.1 universal stress protein [Caldimicrobium sp.]